ncbi:Nuclear transport factor 2 [Ceratocystis lukuohia]|uniref:Nuclear transport factor 2 n=2 Tax=Ceratocystis TaxID=5157 RepID=A0A0F8B2P3_CERFI|nr:Nuclear transport factor 2 [Ceratocystis platani]
MAAGYEEVAKQFVTYYYETFSTNRKGLVTLYRDNSMLTFESASTLGAVNIAEKLEALPFQEVKHAVSTIDSQPTIQDGVLVMVTGQLLVDKEQRPMNYSQTFQLMKDASGDYFVFNDIFKLVYG